jgi:carbon-monoxide dehydrogenase medium subunit
MKAPPFGYVRAETLADAFRLMAAHGPDAKLLAGGQSLLASLAFRLSEPSVLIDISRVAELRGVSRDGDTLRIGAATVHAAVARDALVKSHVPLLAEAVPMIAHPAIRNRGTIGGSLAYADPAAELPACCIALGATVIATSVKGERRIAATDFFTGLFSTALAEGELIKAIEFPVATTGERSALVEVARRSGDYAMAGLAMRARVEGGVLHDPRLVFFGVGDTAVIARSAAMALAGKAPTGETIAAAQRALDGDLDPPTDQHGGPDMKRQLARTILTRAIARITNTAGARAA